MKLPNLSVRYAPIFFIVLYLIFTFLVSSFGPVLYVNYDRLGVAGYLLAVTVSMVVGYHLAIRKPLVLAHPRQVVPGVPFSRKFFQVMLVLSFVGLAYSIFSFARAGNVNLDVTQVGQAYSDAYVGYERNSGTYSMAFILYTLFSVPNFIATIWGIYFFKKLSLGEKIGVVVVVFGAPLVFALTAGQQKTIGDLIIYLAAIFCLRAGLRGRIITPRTLGLIALIGFIGIGAFTAILSQRYAAIGIDAFNINSREVALVQYDTGHPIFRIFGPNLGFTLSILCMYLGNGLVGLSYALHAPFTWSHMLGFAYPLSVIADRVAGLGFPYYDTYPYIAAYTSGWGETRWYSVFAWFASDFTFPGTVILFGFFAYVYARAWVESITFANPYSILLFSLLTLGAVMMPANNQLMQTPGGMLVLMAVVALYLTYRRAYNQRMTSRTVRPKR